MVKFRIKSNGTSFDDLKERESTTGASILEAKTDTKIAPIAPKDMDRAITKQEQLQKCTEEYHRLIGDSIILEELADNDSKQEKMLRNGALKRREKSRIQLERYMEILRGKK